MPNTRLILKATTNMLSTTLTKPHEALIVRVLRDMYDQRSAGHPFAKRRPGRELRVTK